MVGAHIVRYGYMTGSFDGISYDLVGLSGKRVFALIGSSVLALSGS